MGSRPTHEGNVTVKDGDKWRKIGECVVWNNNSDGSISGVIIIENVKSNFRAWKVWISLFGLLVLRRVLTVCVHMMVCYVVK
jgi:hypothetical protein